MAGSVWGGCGTGVYLAKIASDITSRQLRVFGEQPKHCAKDLLFVDSQEDFNPAVQLGSG